MLYIVCTPIGNLEDLSIRQAKSIAQAEIILAEDTRSAHNLRSKIPELFNFTIHPDQKVVSYYKDKEFEKLPQVMNWLHEGKEVALISDAGMPGISDPGFLLFKTAIRQEVPFVVIPGPSAVTTSLLYSGLNPQNFMFLGFLPKRPNDIKKILEKTKQVKTIFKDVVFVCFDSPNRINETLGLMHEIIPQSDICVTRELTKIYEEAIRGTAEELKNKEFRGEITIVFH